MSEETRRKMSLAKKGKLPKNFGKDFGGKGENHYHWKGGISPLSNQIRSCFKYRQWRSDVFQRDDYICQNCGIRGNGELNADHIKLFSQIIKDNNIKNLKEAICCEELWNINNGQTLCLKCHKIKHTV